MPRSNTLPTDPPKGTYTGDGRPNRSRTTKMRSQVTSQEPSKAQTIPHSTSHKTFRHESKKSNSSIVTGSSTLKPARPDGLNRQNSVQTRYMNMLLSLDTIPRMHNIYISFFSCKSSSSRISNPQPSTINPLALTSSRDPPCRFHNLPRHIHISPISPLIFSSFRSPRCNHPTYSARSQEHPSSLDRKLQLWYWRIGYAMALVHASTELRVAFE